LNLYKLNSCQYSIDVCPVNKSHIGSLQYVVDNCFRKILDAKSTETVRTSETVRQCITEFNSFRRETFNINHA